MEIESLNTVGEGMNLSLRLIEVFMLTAVLVTIAGLVIYVAGAAWFWFEGKRRGMAAPRTARRAPQINTRRQARAPFIHEEIDMIGRTVKSISLSLMMAILVTTGAAAGPLSTATAEMDAEQARKPHR